MARKKSKKQQQQTALVLHKTPALGKLLERARTVAPATVRAYLSAGGSASALVELSPDVQVPLLHAIFLFGHDNHRELAESVDMLVSAGADIDCTSTGFCGNTNMWACRNIHCCMEPLQALLKAGAAVHQSTQKGATAVMIAASGGNLKAVEVLLEHGADPFAVDADGSDAVYYTAGSGNLALLELLMNLRDNRDDAAAADSTPPLVAAAINGQLQCAEWLLSRGDAQQQINAADRTGWTALHYAADCCDCSHMLQLLLSHGADVHAYTDEGADALGILVQSNGSLQCAELLLAAGADATHLNNEGEGSLQYAVCEDEVELLQLLLQLLLQHGAAAVINQQCLGCACTDRDLTALMVASIPAITRLLLAHGADVHIRTARGNTCLHVAAKHGYPASVMCLLIKAGADLTAVNNDGKTAADVALAKEHELAAALLNRAAIQNC
jgi:ankyrin repeat protein